MQINISETLVLLHKFLGKTLQFSSKQVFGAKMLLDYDFLSVVMFASYWSYEFWTLYPLVTVFSSLWGF